PCGYPVCLKHIGSPHRFTHVPRQRPKAPMKEHFHSQVRVQFGLVLSFQAASVPDTATTIVATTIATRAAISRTVNRCNISTSHSLKTACCLRFALPHLPRTS